MGTHCSSELRRGHKGIIFIMKLLLLTALATIAAAEPWGYYGYHPVVGNSPTLQWPGYSGPGFSRQTFGLRGKRSAEREPYYGYYGLYHPYGYYGLGRGVAGHAGGGVSYTHRSPQGIGKRSAEPEPHYGYYGLYHPYGYYGLGNGVAAHPTGGSSYVAPTTWGIGRDPLKNPNKLSPPTPTVAPATSAKPSGDSPGPRGPLNPNLSTDTTVSTTPTLMDLEPTDPELPPTPAPPLLTPKGLPKVSAARGPPKLKLTMVTTATNFLGLPFVPPDSLPPPGELVLMVSTGVEKLSKPLLLKRSEFKTKKCKKPC